MSNVDKDKIKRDVYKRQEEDLKKNIYKNE